MRKLECPYCEEKVEHDREQSAEDELYETQCPCCKHNFTFTVGYLPCFTEHKAPCLNGGPHSYQQIIGWPQEIFDGKLRCEHCGKETKKEQEL